MSLLDRARVELPGASDNAIRLAAWEVLHEFFNESSCWQEGIPINVLGDGLTVSYPITSVGPPPGQIVRLLGVTDINQIAQPASMKIVEGQQYTPVNSSPAGVAAVEGSVPQDIGVVTFQTPYQQVQTMMAVVALVPLAVSPKYFPVYPGWANPLYEPGILDGILGRMMSQPTKSYSNETLGVYHLKRFEACKARARVAALRSNTYGVNSWAYPQSFRTRGQRGGVSVGNATQF